MSPEGETATSTVCRSGSKYVVRNSRGGSLLSWVRHLLKLHLGSASAASHSHNADLPVPLFPNRNVTFPNVTFTGVSNSGPCVTQTSWNQPSRAVIPR